MYLKMYLDGVLVEEVLLNHNGLSKEEREWYNQGVVKHLHEVHEDLIEQAKTRPFYCIENLLSNHREWLDPLFID